MIGRRMTSACWCQSPKSHRADFIRWSGKRQCSCFQCGSLTFYATPYFVSYLRFLRPLHGQALVMSRNIAKSMAQMSRCPNYSPESVFPEVTAAIMDAIALHSAVNSGCSEAVLDAVEPFPTPPPSSQPILDPRFVATSDVSWCPSIYSQSSLLHLFLALFAPTFLARSQYFTGPSWRSLKSMLSSQAASSSF